MSSQLNVKHIRGWRVVKRQRGEYFIVFPYLKDDELSALNPDSWKMLTPPPRPRKITGIGTVWPEESSVNKPVEYEAPLPEGRKIRFFLKQPRFIVEPGLSETHDAPHYEMHGKWERHRYSKEKTSEPRILEKITDLQGLVKNWLIQNGFPTEEPLAIHVLPDGRRQLLTRWEPNVETHEFLVNEFYYPTAGPRFKQTIARLEELGAKPHDWCGRAAQNLTVKRTKPIQESEEVPQHSFKQRGEENLFPFFVDTELFDLPVPALRRRMQKLWAAAKQYNEEKESRKGKQ